MGEILMFIGFFRVRQWVVSVLQLGTLVACATREDIPAPAPPAVLPPAPPAIQTFTQAIAAAGPCTFIDPAFDGITVPFEARRFTDDHLGTDAFMRKVSTATAAARVREGHDDLAGLEELLAYVAARRNAWDEGRVAELGTSWLLPDGRRAYAYADGHDGKVGLYVRVEAEPPAADEPPWGETVQFLVRTDVRRTENEK